MKLTRNEPEGSGDKEPLGWHDFELPIDYDDGDGDDDGDEQQGLTEGNNNC